MLSLRDSCFSYIHGKVIERGVLWKSKLFDDKKLTSGRKVDA
jgi:hypothetical protein